MDNSIKRFVIFVVAVTTVLAVGITGCTYHQEQSDQRYYDSVRRCIDMGGSVIPHRSGGTTCVQSNPRQP